jgi:hypothetical protein
MHLLNVIESRCSLEDLNEGIGRLESIRVLDSFYEKLIFSCLFKELVEMHL